MFQAIGADYADTLASAGVRRVSHDEARDLCGIRYKSEHLEGVAFPYLDPNDDRIVTWRVRRDHPEIDSDGTPIAKYVSPPDRKHLYFPPGAFPQLADTSAPVIVVESEKAVLAIAAARLRTNQKPWPLPIAIGGCWGFRAVIGKATGENGARVDQKGPLPDFDRVTWTGRDTIILFDANAATNDKVQAAQRALAAELTRRGAKVRIAELPVEDGINGPDDYIGTHGDAALFALLDAAKPAGTKTTKKEKPKQGRDVQLEDLEPWADPVDGAALLDETASIIRRHVILSGPQADAAALWAGAAHAIDGLQRMPMLLFSSPTPECGKTTAATTLSGLVPRPVMVANLTPAVLFRLLDRYQPTLIADEVDSWLNDEKSELRGVFNAAHWRSGAVIPRCVGERHDVQLFSVFGAKLLAMIGRPPATMLSRSIVITLRRKAAGERIEPLREDRLLDALTPLRRRWRRWALDYLEALRVHDPDLPAGFPVNRASDNWRPLLAIADLAGGSWPSRARTAALALSGVRETDDEPENVQLLADVKIVFDDHVIVDYLSSEDIITALKALSERPWGDWNKGRGISPAQLARRLRDFGSNPGGLRTRKTRLDPTKTAQRWHRADFTDAWGRYLTSDALPDLTANPEHPEHPNVSGPEPAISNPEQTLSVPVSKNAVLPMFTESVPHVPDSSADLGKGDEWEQGW